MSVTTVLDVAAVGLGRRGGRSGLSVRTSATRHSRPSSSPNGLIPTSPGPGSSTWVRDVADAAGRRAEVDRRRPAADAAAAQLAPRNSSLVATRSWARVRTRSGSSTSTWVSGGSSSTSISISSTSAGERLHALDGDPRRDLVGELGQLRVLRAELGRAAAYVVGEQQLAARRRPQPLDRLEGALVGDREGADLLDLVAPELDPQRVLLGGRRPRTRWVSA